MATGGEESQLLQDPPEKDSERGLGCQDGGAVEGMRRKGGREKKEIKKLLFAKSSEIFSVLLSAITGLLLLHPLLLLLSGSGFFWEAEEADARRDVLTSILSVKLWKNFRIYNFLQLSVSSQLGHFNSPSSCSSTPGGQHPPSTSQLH